MDKNISIPKDLKVIGYPATETIRKKLEEESNCFGQLFSEEDDECKKCVAPVIVNGQLRLMNEVCESFCKKEKAPANYRKLSSSKIKTLLQKGATLPEIFKLMIGEDYSQEDAVEARKCLRYRLYYLENAKDYPTPELPSLQELIDG